MREKELAAFLQQYKGRPLKLIEVCGTHTSALYRTGLRQLLPERITLVSGPGCPVCVTPTSYIDKLVEYAFAPGCRVMTFGDMLAVPGSNMSLAEARDQGGAADFFYSPEEMLEKAKAQPETTFILAAVGFETTSVLQNYGFGTFLKMWALISVNLAVFNLLPFPGLDGWQLLVLGVEVIFRKKIPEKVKNIMSFIGKGVIKLALNRFIELF